MNANSENELNEPLLPAEVEIYGECHPLITGEPGVGYEFQFRDKDGRRVRILLGEKAAINFRRMFTQMDADDAAERLLG
jgi:hypothetical protein